MINLTRGANARPSLPEVLEQNASTSIREIYADIKRAQGTPLVNLIYRHLATIPGGLEWVWGSVRTVWGYQRLREAAGEMPFSNMTLVLPTTLWRIAGVADKDRLVIRALVEDYNLTNAANILAITALSDVLRRPDLPAGEPQLAVQKTTGATQMRSGLPIPELDSLAPDVLDLVLFTNQIGEIQSPTMVASMFRHLAIWPGGLAITAALLQTMAESGRLEELRQNTIACAERLAADLAADAPNGFPRLPESASCERIVEALDMFRTTLIAKMLPVGHILKSALSLE